MNGAPHETMTILIPAPRLSTVFAPVWLAEALGYAAEDGIEIVFDLARSGSPKAAVEGVIAGHGDMTFVNIVFPLLTLDRGIPLKPFYGFVRTQNRSFTVPKESPIRSLAQLRGKVIGLHFDDSELFAFVRAVLAGEGIDPEREVSFTPLPGTPLDAPRMAAALCRREVDAVWQLDILSGLMAAEGVPLRHLASPMIDSLTPSSCLCALDRSLAARPRAFGAIGRAVAKATLFAIANPAAAIRLLWQRFPQSGPLPGEDEGQVFRRELAALTVRLEGQRIEDKPVPKWGAITEREMAGWQDFLVKTKAVGTRQEPSACYSDTLVPEFNAFDPAPIIARARGHRA